MSAEIENIPRELLPDTQLADSLAEPAMRRLIVFGSYYYGGGELREAIVNELDARKITDVEVFLVRNVDNISESFAEASDSTAPPMGVIALPQMRHYNEHGRGYVTTPVTKIDTLCRKHGVPLVLFDPKTGTEGVAVSLGELVGRQSTAPAQSELPSA